MVAGRYKMNGRGVWFLKLGTFLFLLPSNSRPLLLPPSNSLLLPLLGRRFALLRFRRSYSLHPKSCPLGSYSSAHR